MGSIEIFKVDNGEAAKACGKQWTSVFKHVVKGSMTDRITIHGTSIEVNAGSQHAIWTFDHVNEIMATVVDGCPVNR